MRLELESSRGTPESAMGVLFVFLADGQRALMDPGGPSLLDIILSWIVFDLFFFFLTFFCQLDIG